MSSVAPRSASRVSFPSTLLLFLSLVGESFLPRHRWRTSEAAEMEMEFL
jgi:hypothetical protein